MRAHSMTDGSERAKKKSANRRRLIEATIDSIADNGLTETTVSTVVARAGLSRGIVNLQFESKQALLVETLRYLGEEWRLAWHRALERAGPEPAAQLRATVFASFEPPVFTRKRLSVWHAFWADSTHRSTYRAVCGASDRVYRRRLIELCRALVRQSRDAKADPELIADSLSALVSGLWVDLLTIPRTITRARARRLCDGFLALQFPAHFPRTGADSPTAGLRARVSDARPAERGCSRPSPRIEGG